MSTTTVQGKHRLDMSRPAQPSLAAPAPAPAPAPVAARAAAWTAALRAGRLVMHTVATLMFVASMALFLLLAVGPHVFGYRTAGMLTGSMTGTINVGDVVIDRKLPADQLKVGMIITYHIPVDDHRTVSHRVVAVQRLPDGGISFQTKGDANPAVDPWTAIVSDPYVWQVRAVVPHLNSVIRQLRATIATPWLLAGGPFLVATWFIVGVWRANDDDEGDGAEPSGRQLSTRQA